MRGRADGKSHTGVVADAHGAADADRNPATQGDVYVDPADAHRVAVTDTAAAHAVADAHGRAAADRHA